MLGYLYALKQRISLYFLRRKVGKLGVHVHIKGKFQILTPALLTVEDYVYIGPECYFQCNGKITIQRGAVLGPRVKMYSSTHRFHDAEYLPYDTVLIKKPIVVGENVWIGGDVILLPGVELGEGCVVGAGAVVTKSFPPYAILGGNPARIIGQRDEAHYRRLKAEDKVYLKRKYTGHAG